MPESSRLEAGVGADGPHDGAGGDPAGFGRFDAAPTGPKTERELFKSGSSRSLNSFFLQR